MQTITKFQIGRKYYPSEKSILLQILKRNGKVTITHRAIKEK